MKPSIMSSLRIVHKHKCSRTPSPPPPSRTFPPQPCAPSPPPSPGLRRTWLPPPGRWCRRCCKWRDHCRTFCRFGRTFRGFATRFSISPCSALPTRSTNESLVARSPYTYLQVWQNKQTDKHLRQFQYNLQKWLSIVFFYISDFRALQKWAKLVDLDWMNEWMNEWVNQNSSCRSKPK